MMKKKVFVLSSCDAWKGRDSMRILGVTTDKAILCAMAASRVRSGDMEYRGEEGMSAYRKLLNDFAAGKTCWEMLEYGYVEAYDDIKTEEPLSVDDFPGISDIYKEITDAEIGKLGLDRRRLVWSVAEAMAGRARGSFPMPGFCDRYRLEKNSEFQEMMKSADDMQVTVGLFTYSAGVGIIERPDSAEMEIIIRHEGEINRRCDVEQIQADFFGFRYEGRAGLTVCPCPPCS